MNFETGATMQHWKEKLRLHTFLLLGEIADGVWGVKKDTNSLDGMCPIGLNSYRTSKLYTIYSAL